MELHNFTVILPPVLVARLLKSGFFWMARFTVKLKFITKLLKVYLTSAMFPHEQLVI